MSTEACNFKYRRLLLKLSGEALMGEQQFGISTNMLSYIVSELEPLLQSGIQMGLVLGGGNLFRGAALQKFGIGRTTGDYVGMLATVMNALVLNDVLNTSGIVSSVMSALPIGTVVQPFDSALARDKMSRGEVVIFSGGTGSPFFTTDSAACLRAVEMEVDLVLKATKVDGIYDTDPLKNKDAVRFDVLTYADVIKRDLQVMDLTAICLIKEHNIPMNVFSITKAGALVRIIAGKKEGTMITGSI